MDTLLRDFYCHQAWADAEHWRALEAHPGALDDDTIRKRLHHLHLVQRAFLAVARGEPLQLREFHEYGSMAELRDEARRCHEDAGAFLDGVDDARLAENVTIPWFKNPPCAVTLAQALTQAAMHSHYHRGQNAARLRELGAAPPPTDFIIWLWKGRPGPQWT